MAGTKDVTVRAQALDGTWQVIGGESARGLHPEGVVLEADGWGPSSASFNLRRDPAAFWPDIGAFTPIEFDVGSALVWSGRVKDTPSQVAQRVMNVQCEGWQYHLDDDAYRRTYVHSKLSDWRDSRTYGSVDLTVWRVSGIAQTGDGTIILGWANNTNVQTNQLTGVVLDMGMDQTAKRVSVDWVSSNNDAGVTCYCKADDDPGVNGPSNDAFNFVMNSGGSGTSTGTFPTAKRYVKLFLAYTGAAGTWNKDVTLKITGIRVYADTAYESGNQSSLKASQVVPDALDHAVLLSTDRSGITTTSFNIPECNLGVVTPRQAWVAVDAYHDWLKQIDVKRQPVYQPKPTRPVFEVGAWSAIDDDDASANSGEEIFSKVIVTGQSADGQQLNVLRPQGTSAQLPFFQGSGGAGGPGGSFAVNLTVPTAKPFKKGVTYAARVLSLTITSFVSAGTLSAGQMGSGTGAAPWTAGDIVAYPDISVTGNGTSGPYGWVFWTPTADETHFGYSATWTGDFTFSFKLDASWGSTLVERRGFARAMQLPVSSALPSDGTAAGVIGDTWLADHRTTPFKGSLHLTGGSALRHIATGRDVGPEELLLNTGQLIRFSDRSDPDTGGHGRDGRIAAVSYQPASDSAVVTIDSSRTSFPALLSRLAVIQGG